MLIVFRSPTVNVRPSDDLPAPVKILTAPTASSRAQPGRFTSNPPGANDIAARFGRPPVQAETMAAPRPFGQQQVNSSRAVQDEHVNPAPVSENGRPNGGGFSAKYEQRPMDGGGRGGGSADRGGQYEEYRNPDLVLLQVAVTSTIVTSTDSMMRITDMKTEVNVPKNSTVRRCFLLRRVTFTYSLSLSSDRGGGAFASRGKAFLRLNRPFSSEASVRRSLRSIARSAQRTSESNGRRQTWQ